MGRVDGWLVIVTLLFLLSCCRSEADYIKPGSFIHHSFSTSSLSTYQVTGILPRKQGWIE